jgi:hypothetical protein
LRLLTPVLRLLTPDSIVSLYEFGRTTTRTWRKDSVPQAQVILRILFHSTKKILLRRRDDFFAKQIPKLPHDVLQSDDVVSRDGFAAMVQQSYGSRRIRHFFNLFFLPEEFVNPESLLRINDLTVQAFHQTYSLAQKIEGFRQQPPR